MSPKKKLKIYKNLKNTEKRYPGINAKKWYRKKNRSRGAKARSQSPGADLHASAGMGLGPIYPLRARRRPRRGSPWVVFLHVVSLHVDYL